MCEVTTERTVPTLNSCTKCVGNPCIIHDRFPPSVMGTDACITSQLKVALIRIMRGSLLCLAYSFDVKHRCFYNEALKTSDRLVQNLNVCTVGLFNKICMSLMCFAHFLNCCPRVFTTRHWQTSSRLVQELNVCIVLVFSYDYALNVKNCEDKLTTIPYQAHNSIHPKSTLKSLV